MKHYGMADWVDFVRHTVSDADKAVLRAHLADGCGECAESVAFSEKLSGICQVMARQTAPDEVVRRAHAIFPIPEKVRVPRVFRIPVELIYDSFLVPAPAGLRSAWQVGWQGLYRAGDCALDLRIEPEPESVRAAIIGQISNHVMPEEPLAGLPVRIKTGKSVVAETRSNQYGEFQMEYSQERGMQLSVHLKEETRFIQVTLKSVGMERFSDMRRLRMSLPPERSTAERQ